MSRKKQSLSPTAPRSQINLDKPSDSGSRRINLDKKPGSTESSTTTFGVQATRELGSLGGVRVTEDVQGDLGSVLGPQEISINVDPVKQSISAEVELGIRKGFGINLGAEVAKTPTGASVSNVSFGVNVLGFGVNAEGRGSDYGKLGVSAFGINVSIANDENGQTSIRLGIDLPGFGWGVTFQPDGKKKEEPSLPPPPPPLPNEPITTETQLTPIENNYIPPGDPICYALIGVSQISWNYYNGIPWECGGQFMSPHFGYDVTSRSTTLLNVLESDEEIAVASPVHSLPPRFKLREISDASLNAVNWSMLDFANSYYGYGAREVITGERSYRIVKKGLPGGWPRVQSAPGGIQYVECSLPEQESYTPSSSGDTKDYSAPSTKNGLIATGRASAINTWLNALNQMPSNNRKVINQQPGRFSSLPQCITVGGSMYYFQYMVNRFIVSKPPKIEVPQNLPNQPQKYKHMECCDKVEEIYKYLGIAKLKKQKMKIAKQFLVPGGSGTEDCEDYYQITQALFKMLANGLIINPVSKPLGTNWQSVNATAWAEQIYEMTAEAMSNGDSTQKFEISAIMQLVQTMSAVAELSRKVDFLSEVLGTTPDLDTEDLPVCFTIHEVHKGFEKKPPKEIDVSGAKTDIQVEKVLGKMLQPSKIPIVKWVFKPDSISIAAALSRL